MLQIMFYFLLPFFGNHHYQANDFTDSVIYVIHAEDLVSTQEWNTIVDVAAGINELFPEVMNIFPDPFFFKTTIKLPNLNLSNYKLSIFSISGNKVFEMDNIKSDKIEFERGKLPKRGLSD